MSNIDQEIVQKITKGANARAIRASANQFNRAIKNPDEYVKYALHPDTPLIWYTLLHGIKGANDEYTGGEYLVRFEVDKVEHPHKPPWFYFLTPNGQYGLDGKVCVSIGGYHSDQFRGVLGVDGFATQLVSGFIGGLDHGINIKNSSMEEKRRLARESREFNKENYGEIMDLINESYNNYSIKWVKSAPTQVPETAIIGAIDAPLPKTDLENN
jgi:ubiquitin-protein ligase